MAQSNRTSIALVKETTLGTTPNTPRMRLMRMTGESLAFNPSYVDSDEIRADRMLDDPILTMQEAGGGYNFEASYPDADTPLSTIYESAFFNTFTNTPTRYNDGTADSVITDVATTNTVLTVTTGAAFVANHLVKFEGFGVAGNNGVFKCTTGSATVPRFVGSGITDEAAPPAAAKVKVVGFVGDSGDITATSTGLGSTSLDFTTLGLAVGQWIKIGGTAAGDKFATSALNDWVRITAIAATALTVDNRPSGWTTDAGTSKTIKVWFGDRIKNGTTRTGMTIERGFLGQDTPTYIVTKGLVADTMTHTITSRQKVTGSVNFKGMGGSQSTTPLDASPDAATTSQVIAANANVGRIAENGSTLNGAKNWVRSLEISINNNLRTLESVDSQSPVDIAEGECTVTGKIETYFGDNTLLAKFYAGTATSLNCRIAKNSQALIWQLPRVTYRGGGNPSAGGKNQDIMISCDITASQDTTTSSAIMLDRIYYYEA